MIGTIVTVAYVLSLLGMLGGIAFLLFFLWVMFAKSGQAARDHLFPDEEYRCRWCARCQYCDGAGAGASYPCRLYEPEELWPEDAKEDET